MENVLSAPHIMLDSSRNQIDITKYPYTLEYSFQTMNPAVGPESLEEFNLYFTKQTSNGDILLSEEKPEHINARLVIPHRITEVLTGLINTISVDRIELIDSETNENEVCVFAECVNRALSNA